MKEVINPVVLDMACGCSVERSRGIGIIGAVEFIAAGIDRKFPIGKL